jgi:hypothetical protein
VLILDESGKIKNVRKAVLAFSASKRKIDGNQEERRMLSDNHS